jgi:hypothetical protein
MCARAVLVVPEGQRPHPRRSTAEADFKDAANHNAVGHYVLFVLPTFTSHRVGNWRGPIWQLKLM